MGYAPFGIQQINGLIYVTYAPGRIAREHDDGRRPGQGVQFDIYTTRNGLLVKRLASRGRALNAPLGALPRAPAGFGRFGGRPAGSVTSGNGWINAFQQFLRAACRAPLLDPEGACLLPSMASGELGLRYRGHGRHGETPVCFSSGPNGPRPTGLVGSLQPPRP